MAWLELAHSVFVTIFTTGAPPSIVNTAAPSFYISLLSITFNPAAWNIIARSVLGCYFLAILIFTFGLVRDHLYQCALFDQPRVPLFPKPSATLVPVPIFAVGQVFVLSSTYTLGITGTFLGDWESLNAIDNRYERPAGLLITLYGTLPFTNMIYPSHSKVQKEE
ncbi:hypothetical protein EDD16DRAFT_1690910 [Pisolithus croceorrhizus]|nr:hypothetical protein EDD16DRAFT_1690910 [Pisolithus croceorrhizus]